MNRPINSKIIGSRFASTEEAYRAGFARGMSWDLKDKWTPAGPHVYRGKYIDDAKFSRECNKQWVQGWKDAMSTRVKPWLHLTKDGIIIPS